MILVKEYNGFYKSWLISCICLIIAMVVLGGYTRLTNSGLSITEWDLIEGIFPPFNEEQWHTLFNKYKKIPQFIVVNFAMDLEGFKQIFWLEYLHRLIGRITGIVVILPALFFLKYKKNCNKKFVFSVMILIIFQGALGWFMVASGLQGNITVSHFRLAIHLLVAFILFSIITHHTLNNIFPNYLGNRPRHKKYNIIYKLVEIMLIVLTIQIIYGAFVAGLDGGLIYNNFPLMADKIYPEELLNVNAFQALFYNPATVQFIHRTIAFFIIGLNIILFIKVFSGNYERIIKSMTLYFSSLVLLQFLLGVITILTVVNINVAVLHQLCALILYATIFTFYKELKLKTLRITRSNTNSHL